MIPRRSGWERATTVVLGGSGMLGRALCHELASIGREHAAHARSSCDLADPSSVAGLDLAERAVCFNCAAWTDVDGAESQEREASAVNGGEGLAELCRLVRARDALLVHVSTDYVFDGDPSIGRPYLPGDPIAPINAYGRTKAQGEAIIRESGCRHLIVRTSWLYAPWGKNFVRTIASLAAHRPTLRVVHDQRGRPTSAEHLARSLVALVDARAAGVFHVADAGDCTWFEFATEIASRLGLACDVQPCTSSEFPRPAARPRWSVLDLADTERLIGPMPHWTQNLASVLARLEPL
ncbi:MAG: dTDP-4-dehydrorhamnose reductase [Phycisphaeraceae bacterium]|nr:dTDP-4-dehydrorhamnose reductase [Phycisphaeraceae bacterium]